jgi:hypothetical protein
MVGEDTKFFRMLEAWVFEKVAAALLLGGAAVY